MDILCIRGSGDRPGDDITDPLLSTVEAGLSRGRAELDEGALSDEQRLERFTIGSTDRSGRFDIRSLAR